MARKRKGFDAVFEAISLEARVTELRPAVLRDIFSKANKKRVAAELNRELAHFNTTFIKTFMNSDLQNPFVQDTSPDPLPPHSAYTYWVDLSHKWQREKAAKGLDLPGFFHYGQERKKAKNRPKKTLTQYLETNWNSATAINAVGRITEEDIFFRTKGGEDVTLKGGKAALDSPFLGKLKTASGDIKDVKETFTIGFRSFTKISVDRLMGTKFADRTTYGLLLTEKMVPKGVNTAGQGFPLSKLTNNAQISDDRAFRPTVMPLLKWYYSVKLPHTFRQFYGLKGLKGWS